MCIERNKSHKIIFVSTTFGKVYLPLPTPQGKRLLIKDIGHYLLPPDQKPVSIAPSLDFKRRGVGTPTNGVTNGVSKDDVAATDTNAAQEYIDPSAPSLYPYSTSPEPNNPTGLPLSVLQSFHWTFLIRHPRSSIPSYYRCTVPPLCDTTGFYNYMPSEAGYGELRRLFTYLRDVGVIASEPSSSSSFDAAAAATPSDEKEEKENPATTTTSAVKICVVDADDLLDNPAGIVKAFCQSTGLEYHPGMLTWDTEEDRRQAKEAFEKWNGFHDDAMESTGLRQRVHVSFCFVLFSFLFRPFFLFFFFSFSFGSIPIHTYIHLFESHELSTT